MSAAIAIPGALVILGVLPGIAWAGYAGLAMALLVCAWLGRDFPKPQRTDYVVLSAAAVTLLHLLFGQGDFGAQRLASAAAGILLYALLRPIRVRLIGLRWTLLSLGGLGAVLAGYSLLWSREWIARVLSAGFADVTALKGNLLSVLRGPVNEWATVMVLLLVLQAAAIRPVRERFFARNAFAIGAMLPVAAALCLTFSRGAYAAAVFFIAAVAALAVGSSSVTPYARKRLIASLFLVIAVSAVAADRLSGGGVRRTAAGGATEQQRRSASGRFRVWSSAMELASPHWLLGSGPGTFAMRYVPKAGLAEGRSYVGRPLNTALALLVEEGTVGLGLQALLALAIVVSAWRASAGSIQITAGKTGGATGAFRARVLALGCVAFWVREMTFSSLLENRLVMALYWVLLGLLALHSAPPRTADRKPRLSYRIALTALATAAVLVFGAEERWKSADRAAVEAARALQDGDPDGALAAADRAVSIRPVPAHYGLRALIRARDAMPAWDAQRLLQTPQDSGARKRLRDAQHDLDLALAGNPDDDLFRHNRAWVRLALGAAPDDAMPDMRRAVAIDGGSACYRVGLGLLLEQQGRAGEAGEQYAAALAAAPESCDSEFARDLKSRSASLWQAVLSRATGILQARDPKDRDVSDRARLARLYLERGQTARARTMLETVTKAMPQFPRAWANQGRIYLDSGDLAQAELYLGKAAFLDGGDPVVPALLARLAKANGDEEAAESLEDRAAMAAGRQASRHAQRLNRMYKTNAIVPDDVLPAGLLAYCTPTGKQDPAPREATTERGPSF